MKMRKLAASVTAIATSFAMAACSGSAKPAATTAAAAAPASTAAATTAAASAAAGSSAAASTEAAATGAGTVTTVIGDQATKKPADDTIRIGVLSYLSDSKAQTRMYFQIGWETAARMALDKGLLKGKNVEFVMFDPGNDGAMDQQRLSELVDMGSVGLLHAAGDGLAPSSAQWAATNKIPVVSAPNASTALIFDNWSDYYWNGGTKMAWTVGKLVGINAVADGKKTAVYVGKDGAACQDAINLMVWEAQKLDPEFKLIGDYRVNDNDFTSVVSAVMSQQPDMVLEQGAGSTFVSFMQTAQQYDLCSTIDVYDDFAADSATGAPMVEAGTFPFGKIHGCVQLAYWDDKYMTGDIKTFYDLACSNEMAKNMNYFAPVTSMSCYYTITSLLTAIDSCMQEGTDYTNPEVLNAAIGKVKWSDSLGDHFYREFDHQLTNSMWYGTADDVSPETASPICSNVKIYTYEECMPTKQDYKEYAEHIGFDAKGRFD